MNTSSDHAVFALSGVLGAHGSAAGRALSQLTEDAIHCTPSSKFSFWYQKTHSSTLSERLARCHAMPYLVNITP